MRKSLFTLAPVAVLLMSVAGTAQAKDNAQITITGNVQSATCDVKISSTTLDLGTHKPADFTAAKTPVTASTKPFTLALENCDTPAAAGTASLKLSGTTIVGASNMFSEDPTATYGVMLEKVGTAGTYFSTGEEIPVHTITGTPAAGDLDGKTLPLQASLAKVTATAPSTGTMKAPLLFQFIYN